MTIPMILGPTAVGKTEILLALSERLPIEVVSVDSRQIYRYMDIGTAKPLKEELKKVPHHLINIVDPDEEYNAYRFKEEAKNAIINIKARNKIPVLAGGTGLYADALLKGFVKDVPRNETVRNALRVIEEETPGALRKILEKVDPKASEKIHPNDLKRTIRYLEVFFTTGITLSSIQKNTNISKDYTVIILDRDRSSLHRRIENRVDQMMKAGLLDETKKLLKMGFSEDLNALQTIGYAELIAYLKGVFSLEKAVELIKRNTRRYARRQIIWFRRYKNACWLNLSEFEFKEVVDIINEKILFAWGGKGG
ncbi:tRNA (adenosine(37)-N6)-dimethylallyltransferase MiaA [Kosmotoga pacifica]|uniref:tRNA dimethylallyltransferase n=1 Tax=Kosmotoga pacifica TaxID=1330330 RepID=A0A0G2ZEV1_9BACT|nr:tRNA (adenosine(37)-N6)-dimethylallyltransferase MiaA [Kosmotoga pacifica]AKI98074.1 tRNA delta(2)-isopentenylpyrophosphate transferase [Kosmotoga pacifica]